ncbi:MAG: hypothetical protein CMH64_01660 [Nanoarchaeota archaeon]|nr:hypothetical protein [Nanoarchaeota archaeon]
MASAYVPESAIDVTTKILNEPDIPARISYYFDNPEVEGLLNEYMPVCEKQHKGIHKDTKKQCYNYFYYSISSGAIGAIRTNTRNWAID